MCVTCAHHLKVGFGCTLAHSNEIGITTPSTAFAAINRPWTLFAFFNCYRRFCVRGWLVFVWPVRLYLRHRHHQLLLNGFALLLLPCSPKSKRLALGPPRIRGFVRASRASEAVVRALMLARHCPWQQPRPEFRRVHAARTKRRMYLNHI